MPVTDLAHVDVERRLIELDHIDTVGLQRPRFLLQFGEGERHPDAIAIVAVGDGIDDGHRAGQGEFQVACGVGAGDARLIGVDAALRRNGATTCGTIAL